MTVINDKDRIDRLRAEVKGSVIAPGDAQYDTARFAWNLVVDQHPALVVFPTKAQDVVAAVRYAREAGLDIAIQSSGHGVHHAADDALLIVISRLRFVEVNAEARTARVGAGVVWQDVLEKVTPLGLAPLLGTSPQVGVAGYSLGGGIGWLLRKYGAAADSVISIDVVTADGALRHASATENADLFFGLRGGGVGSLGVVTALEFKLYPVTKLYGGRLTYPAELASDALRFYREWTQNLPDAMTSSMVLFRFPNVEQVPEAVRGQVQMTVRAAYVGPAEEGAALMQPWLDWQTPLENNFRELPFSEVGAIAEDPIDPQATYPWNDMLTGLNDDVIGTIVRHVNQPDTPLIFNELRHLGGAFARGDNNGSAVGNRSAAFSLTVGGLGQTRQAQAALREYIDGYRADLRPYTTGGLYLNFSNGDDDIDRVPGGLAPGAFEKLVALKAKYDPDNVFCFGVPYTASV